MIIDISSYNGKVNFAEMTKNEEIERVIMRSTTKNGKLDTRLIENLNGALAELNDDVPLDIYKFTYAKSYDAAIIEAFETLQTLANNGLLKFFNNFWLDIENHDGSEYSQYECASVIAAYALVCPYFGVKLGIYCNYSYLKNIVPKWANLFDFWLARWGGSMGKCEPFNVVMWQYTNKGQCAGITGDVDLSRYVGKC